MEVDCMSWFPIALHTSGIFIVTRAGLIIIMIIIIMIIIIMIIIMSTYIAPYIHMAHRRIRI